ncbi:MAG TPA: cyclic nucleotide-binding domain-containing protein [Candidatus Kryptobacter bacterium]|nr:cyclic nucleotide-binding domain-containing protein [Candidatus Kryptobacter bacterium]
MTENIAEQNSLWHNFFRKATEEDKSIEGLLSKVPIFSKLTERELRRVGSIVHRREYAADEFVFRQGDPGLGMYVVEEGQVDILLTEPDGNQKQLTVLNPGDFFGELSLLDESPRSASAVAKTNSKIIGFFRPDLVDLLNRSPKSGTKILFKLGEVIGARLRITNEQLGKLSTELESRPNKKEGGRHANRQS